MRTFVVVTVHDEWCSAERGGIVDPDKAVLIAARGLVADKDIHVQSGETADVLREDGVLPPEMRIRPVG